MAEIIYIVKTKQDEHGDIVPAKYENCPIFKETHIKHSCYSMGKFCECFSDTNIVKEIDQINYLFECKYGG